MSRKTTPAVAYLRTSSASNVGADKDSDKRQLEAIAAFARAAGYTVAPEAVFYDMAVRGSDPIDIRPGFAALLARIGQTGERVILVENAGRFARDLSVQLTGHALLLERGVELIPVDAPTYFTDPSPTAEMVRQILGAVAQFEKAALVHKLKGARDRKRAAGAKVEGRKSLIETRPEVVALAKLLHRARPKGGRLPLRSIADQLAARGFLTSPPKRPHKDTAPKGARPYTAEAIRRMIAGPAPSPEHMDAARRILSESRI